MAGRANIIILNREFKAAGNKIPKNTEIYFWNHGKKTKLRYQIKNKKITRCVLNINFEKFEKIIKKST